MLFNTSDVRLYDNTQQYFNASGESQLKIGDFFLNNPKIKLGDLQPLFNDRERKNVRGFEINFLTSPKEFEDEFNETLAALIITVDELPLTKALSISSPLSQKEEAEFASWLSEDSLRTSGNYLSFVFATSANDCYEVVVEDTSGLQPSRTRYYIASESLIPIAGRNHIMNNTHLKSNLDKGSVEFYFPARETPNVSEGQRMEDSDIVKLYVDIFIEQLIKDATSGGP